MRLLPVLFDAPKSLFAICSVLAMTGCSASTPNSATTDSGQTTSAPAVTTSAPAVTSPSATDVPPSTSSSVPDTGVSVLLVDWKTPPVLAAPGVELTFAFSLSANPASGDVAPTVPDPDEVAVVVSGLDAPITERAAFDAVSASWTAVVRIPGTAVGDRLDVSAVFGESGSSEPLSIPLVTDSSVIEPTFTNFEPAVVTELSWGDGDGQVGRLQSEGAETLVPQSLDVNRLDGSIVVLDTVNERLVVVDASSGASRPIPLPVRDGWYVQDVIVMGLTGRAAVVTYPAAGEQRIGVFDVDLVSGVVDDSNGPRTTPAFASNLPMFWNSFERTVTARIQGLDFPFYAADTATFLPELLPRVWFDVLRVEDPGAVGITQGGVDVLTAVAGVSPTITGFRMNEDGSFWQIAQTIDLSVEPAVVTSVLLFTTPGAHRTLATNVDVENRYPYSRQLATDGKVAYVAVPTDSGYRIDRYAAE